MGILLVLHKLIDNGTKVKKNLDFDASLKNAAKIQSQFLVYKLRLLTTKIYPNFMRVDHFLSDL